MRSLCQPTSRRELENLLMGALELAVPGRDLVRQHFGTYWGHVSLGTGGMDVLGSLVYQRDTKIEHL